MRALRGIILVICGAGLWILAEKHIQFDQAFQISFGTFAILYGLKWIFLRADK
jgi:hypothetical protein